MKSPLIIFDFDGTLCDSYLALITALNAISADYGFRKIKQEEVDSLRDLGSRAVLKEIGISPLKLPLVVRRIKKQLRRQVPQLAVVSGMPQLLRSLRKSKVCLALLSSNSRENVAAFLKTQQLQLFDFICTGSKVFGKDRRLKNILSISKRTPDKDRLFYVGDETRDVHAARKAQFTAIAVSWGYNSAKALRQARPDHLFQTPAELGGFLESNLE